MNLNHFLSICVESLKVSEIREWIKHVSKKREELGDHAIYPYAFLASVHVEERARSEVTLIKTGFVGK